MAMMEDQMDEMEPKDNPQEESTEKEDMPSIFLNKADLGDHDCKVGDTITLKVVDKDPETGDVQAEITSYGDTAEKSGAMSDFDKAMPSTPEEGAY